MPRRFFDEKRSWSRLKDRILGAYIAPYLAKVNTLGHRIVLIDAFAGPGKYDDGTAGSPLILVQAAEARAPNNYLAVFVNADLKQHKRLVSLMGGRIEARRVVCVRARASTIIKQVSAGVGNATVLMYLDPFGVKDFELSDLSPFLQRKVSTELLITLQAPILHRLAARHSIAGNAMNSRVATFHRRLTLTFGGNYWKPILLSNQPAEKREEALVAAFTEHLGSMGTMRYAGWCPVREHHRARAKYYFVFCSAHPDAMRLMNDIMLNAYEDHMHETAVAGTLFEGQARTHTSRIPASLKQIILDQVRRTPQRSRLQVWMSILREHFREYSHGQYGRAVKELVQDGRLRYRDTRGTRRLNDDSVLELAH
jgi:three-Cys-motif partner protein